MGGTVLVFLYHFCVLVDRNYGIQTPHDSFSATTGTLQKIVRVESRDIFIAAGVVCIFFAGENLSTLFCARVVDGLAYTLMGRAGDNNARCSCPSTSRCPYCTLTPSFASCCSEHGHTYSDSLYAFSTDSAELSVS